MVGRTRKTRDVHAILLRELPVLAPEMLQVQEPFRAPAVRLANVPPIGPTSPTAIFRGQWWYADQREGLELELGYPPNPPRLTFFAADAPEIDVALMIAIDAGTLLRGVIYPSEEIHLEQLFASQHDSADRERAVRSLRHLEGYLARIIDGRTASTPDGRQSAAAFMSELEGRRERSTEEPEQTVPAPEADEPLSQEETMFGKVWLTLENAMPDIDIELPTSVDGTEQHMLSITPPVPGVSTLIWSLTEGEWRVYDMDRGRRLSTPHLPLDTDPREIAVRIAAHAARELLSVALTKGGTRDETTRARAAQSQVVRLGSFLLDIAEWNVASLSTRALAENLALDLSEACGDFLDLRNDNPREETMHADPPPPSQASSEPAEDAPRSAEDLAVTRVQVILEAAMPGVDVRRRTVGHDGGPHALSLVPSGPGVNHLVWSVADGVWSLHARKQGPRTDFPRRTLQTDPWEMAVHVVAYAAREVLPVALMTGTALKDELARVRAAQEEVIAFGYFLGEVSNQPAASTRARALAAELAQELNMESRDFLATYRARSDADRRAPRAKPAGQTGAPPHASRPPLGAPLRPRVTAPVATRTASNDRQVHDSHDRRSIVKPLAFLGAVVAIIWISVANDDSTESNAPVAAVSTSQAVDTPRAAPRWSTSGNQCNGHVVCERDYARWVDQVQRYNGAVDRYNECVADGSDCLGERYYANVIELTLNSAEDDNGPYAWGAQQYSTNGGAGERTGRRVMCRDGSYSSAGGKQGACSHHGGVSH